MEKVSSQNPLSYSFYFDLNIWFRAWKVTGTFEKRAPGPEELGGPVKGEGSEGSCYPLPFFPVTLRTKRGFILFCSNRYPLSLNVARMLSLIVSRTARMEVLGEVGGGGNCLTIRAQIKEMFAKNWSE